MDQAALKSYLEAKGLWNSDGISRKAKWRHCPKCGLVGLSGLDWPRCGLAVFTDLQCLDGPGELTAVLQGRATFAVVQEGTGLALNRRDRWNRQRRKTPVVVEHQCGQQLPAGDDVIHWRTLLAVTPDEYPEEPPF